MITDHLHFLITHFSPYVMVLGLFSGLICRFLFSSRLKQEGYPLEGRIAKYCGTAYIALSVFLYLIGRFFK